MPQGGPSPVPTARNDDPVISEEKRDDDDSVRMCERIIAIYETLQKHNASPSVGDDHTDIWTKYAEENRVTFDDDVLKNHRYLNEINNFKSSSTKGRLLTIGKEVATMTTSLPAGIFVKVRRHRPSI
jgi:baculoviral IAP repeat-containing protein 6